jgi:hypothetical protein
MFLTVNSYPTEKELAAYLLSNNKGMQSMKHEHPV